MPRGVPKAGFRKTKNNPEGKPAPVKAAPGKKALKKAAAKKASAPVGLEKAYAVKSEPKGVDLRYTMHQDLRTLLESANSLSQVYAATKSPEVLAEINAQVADITDIRRKLIVIEEPAAEATEEKAPEAPVAPAPTPAQASVPAPVPYTPPSAPVPFNPPTT